LAADGPGFVGTAGDDAGVDVAGVVDPRSPSVPAREPMPASLAPPVAPIAASARIASAGAQMVAAATTIARRLTFGGPAWPAAIEEPCDTAE
jgi:hypothetical protein